MKRGLIVLFVIGLFCIGMLYNGKDVTLILNNDSEQEFVFIEVFWDEENVFSDSVSQMKTFPGNKINTSFGKHNLKIIANGTVENKTISVFLIRYVFIDYNGKSPQKRDSKVPVFLITERIRFFYD